MKNFPKEETLKNEKSEVIEIPVGRYLGNVRKNPWILATIVLAVALVFVIFFRNSGAGLSSNSVSEKEAADKLVSFINAQGRGNADFVSSEKEGALYKVTVNFEGQDVPAYVTLDGKYLIAQPIPLTGDVILDAGTNTEVQNNQNNDNPNTDEPVDVNIVGSPIKGSANALVTLVEFTDYECPFCGRYYQQTYSLIVKDYVDTGKVRIVIKDFPLNSIHPEAQKAAEAARCVREQKGDEGYFKMHDKLFENQQDLGVENEKKWARELGVDGAKFDSCLDSGKFADAVQDDLDYGQELGVQGTPSFFINGKMLSGAMPYSSFKQIIDSELNIQG